MQAPIVQAKHLSLSYKHQDAIIKDANFEFYARDFIVITGSSGSGKSTLLKSFYGQSEQMSGYLNVCLEDLNGISAKKLQTLRRKMGIIFQDYKLIKDYDVLKNIMLPLEILGLSISDAKRRAMALLKHVDLVHKATKLPKELSGGEQQRIATARAIANNPKLIICDEPTGNLDPYSADKVWRLLLLAREHFDSCIVVATHHIPINLKINFRLIEIRDGMVNEIY